MAERIVSPGVFTRERDLSFLPQGIAEIGACIIGPTLKGPAFVPTMLSNFPEFEEMFGTTSKDYYTPYAVEQYLRSAGTVTIVRILNTSGYSADSLAITTGTTTAATFASNSVSMSRIDDGQVLSITGSDGTKFKFTAADAPVPADEPSANSYYFLGSGSAATLANRVLSMSIQINAATGIPVSTSLFGGASTNLFVTASNSGTGGNSITFKSGSTTTTLGGGAAAIGGKVLAVLVPSRGGSSGTADLEGSTIIGNWESASLTLSGSNWGAKSLTADGTVNKYSFSFSTGSTNASYIEDVFSRDAAVQKSGQNTVAAYLYKNYKYVQTTSGYSASNTVSVVDGTLGLGITYQNATTPAIQSQTLNGGRYSLFTVKSRSHGSDVNNKYKLVILNVKKAGTIAGSDYGAFSLQLRQTGLNDNNLTKDNILEQWDGLNFDPTSPNYFARRIGDRYVTIDANGKLTYNGDWPNLSKHIYVSDYSEIANNESPKTVVPMGHAAINNPHGSDDSTVPAWTFKATQSNAQGEFDSGVLYGVDYANADAEEYLAPHNSFGNGSNTTMSL